MVLLIVLSTMKLNKSIKQIEGLDFITLLLLVTIVFLTLFLLISPMIIEDRLKDSQQQASR